MKQYHRTQIPHFGPLFEAKEDPPACCTGVRNLNSMARTTPDRQQACNCIQTVARGLGSGLNAGRVAGIPKACGVNIPYKISTSTNCKTVR
ncbi:PREDICTED: non-specific lipid-transfer protein 1-like [Camelina sativa]|uniref:Non-specific lipid-transfer protein n=1 Tax=Camelina sativa TaxID=90675 RepID=A0ABM0YT44_CAMSA|nr:PREDICTED: non-specific lipid-transfer protein 1-like [Camelina sativa]